MYRVLRVRGGGRVASALTAGERLATAVPRRLRGCARRRDLFNSSDQGGFR